MTREHLDELGMLGKGPVELALNAPARAEAEALWSEVAPETQGLLEYPINASPQLPGTQITTILPPVLLASI